MNFQIVQQVEGKNFVPAINQRTKGPMIYPCPKQAAMIAARLTRMKGVKFQPRPIADTDWRARERKRIADGAYKEFGWAGQGWWDNHHNPDHFAHLSLTDKTKVAFTRNERDGLADVQTSMKPGRYLTEFFSEVLSAEEIKEFAMQHSTAHEKKELKFATTPLEIQRVYQPHLGCSCFSGTTKANLYGSGDFAVAYLEDGEGNVKARAVCAPSRKIYCRVYGDETRLGKLLQDAGYTATGYSNHKPWLGLRVLKELHWRGFYTDWGGTYHTELGPDPTDDKYLILI